MYTMPPPHIRERIIYEPSVVWGGVGDSWRWGDGDGNNGLHAYMLKILTVLWGWMRCREADSIFVISTRRICVHTSRCVNICSFWVVQTREMYKILYEENTDTMCIYMYLIRSVQYNQMWTRDGDAG